MTQSDFDRFRQLVAEDRALQDKLLEVSERIVFIRLVIELGRQQGLVLTAGDVESALNAGMRSWVERWI
ncbi:MAG: Nif11 family protein [Gammaproteobacteria bacterium]|nr:Nif11 family protein [Gammaproteobacteria bacterium]